MGEPRDQHSELQLPEGVRLVHVGPHKTGTSALQGAMHQEREVLASLGVHVAGTPPRPTRAVWAVTQGTGPLGSPPATMAHWDRLVAEIAEAGDQRVVVSNESFSLARADAIDKIVADLGPDRVHVVAMMRRLDKILPSQWQQMIADGGHRVSYEKWLERVFAGSESFWRRHGYGQLAQRWVDGVGAENVTMVVVDESDREHNLRLFERFLALPTGTLPVVENRENRSLTFGEVEMLREFNKEYHELDWANEVQPHFVRRGAIPQMKRRRPDPGERRITTPRWAQERAADAARSELETVESLGVRVIGDTSGLVRDPEPRSEDQDGAAPRAVDPQIAALAVSGVVDVAAGPQSFGNLQRRPDVPRGRGEPVDPESRRVDRVSTAELVRVLRGRIRVPVRRGRPDHDEARDG